MPYMKEKDAGPSSSSLHSHTQSLTHTSHGSLSGAVASQQQQGIPQEGLFFHPRSAGNLNRVNSLTMKESPRKDGLASDVASLASNTSQVLVQSVVQRLIKRVSELKG